MGDTGKWGCAIYPEGKPPGFALFEPDAVYRHGRLSHFDSDDEAIAAGKFHIRTDFLRG